jgi:hypothetical protein
MAVGSGAVMALKWAEESAAVMARESVQKSVSGSAQVKGPDLAQKLGAD